MKIFSLGQCQDGGSEGSGAVYRWHHDTSVTEFSHLEMAKVLEKLIPQININHCFLSYEWYV